MEKKNRKNSIISSQNSQNINFVIDQFKSVNPSWERLFCNKTQRGSCERLIKKYGQDKVIRMIKAASNCLGKEFAPIITTPYELEMKLAKLIIFYQNLPKKIEKELIPYFWGNRMNKEKTSVLIDGEWKKFAGKQEDIEWKDKDGNLLGTGFLPPTLQ